MTDQETYLVELIKERDATIAELRAQVDTLAKSWRLAEDENDELRAELSASEGMAEGAHATIAELRAEVERLRDLLRAPAREVAENQRDRAERAEASLVEAVAMLRRVLPFIRGNCTDHERALREDVVTILTKVKP